MATVPSRRGVSSCSATRPSFRRLGRIVEAAAVGGGRLIVVDAMDDPAHEFHRHHDFIPVAGAPHLHMKISTARAALDGSAKV